MFPVSYGITEPQLLDEVYSWIEALARLDYQAVYESLGYAVAFDQPGADCIRRAIEEYRHPEFFPGVTEFRVTSPRLAVGGNPTPLLQIKWFESNQTGLLATVELHLPLNGKWSDLEADFVLFQDGAGSYLSLEEICSNTVLY